jgi:hypothetical protein
MGVNVQNFVQLGGRADFLRPFIWSLVSGLMQFLTADQNSSSMSISARSFIIASDNATFLCRVITGDESWIYGYDPETKQQSSQWENPNSPREKSRAGL